MTAAEQPADCPNVTKPHETTARTQLDREETRLLRTYADGPRIWDAASVFEVVLRLVDKGMLAPSGLNGAYALTDAGRHALPAPRQCIYVFETSLTEHGYVPSMITEGQAGHSPMTGNGEHSQPWYWGHDLATARRLAAEHNTKMGLSPGDVIEILVSSFRASDS